MEVILNENVKNLGKAGDVVKVSEGYARNFLFPSKKAVPASAGSMNSVLAQVKKKEEKSKEQDNFARDAAAKIKGLELVIQKKTSEDGKLFGSVAEKDIAEELVKAGHKVDKSNIRLEKHIKEPGTYEVTVHFKGEAEAKITVKVEKQIGSKAV